MSEINPNPLEVLFKSSTRQHLKRGTPLFLEYDRLFFVLIESGYVKRYLISVDGTESIQAIYGPKTPFPLTPVFSSLLNLNIYEGDEILFYEAITDVTFYSLTKDELQKTIDQNPFLYKDLFYAAGIRLKSNIQRLENISLKSADKRVSDILLHYAKNFGKKNRAGEIVIELPLTHQTLANVLTVARETVSISVGKLQEQEIIRVLPKFHIAVIDIDALKNSRQ